MESLLDALGHPEKAFASLHIAGTNGKGSTAAMLASVCQAAGYRTGLYTSPHLIDVRERIQIQGRMISETAFMTVLDQIQPEIDRTEATFFEILTAMAFLIFKTEKVDIAVIETGLGGRLDATNTLVPECTIITEIGLDHTQILGRTLQPIAAEKAGIFKPGIPCIVGSRNNAVNAFFKRKADALHNSIRFSRQSVRMSRVRLTEQGTWADVQSPRQTYADLFLRLLGAHQLDNLATVILSVETLQERGWRLPEASIRQGLTEVTWPARMDLVQTKPKVLLDSAHNPMGMKQLVRGLTRIFRYNTLILLFGVLADKNHRRMLKTIAPLADRIIVTRPLSDRALHPDQLEPIPEIRDKMVLKIPDIREAWKKALMMAGEDDMICAAGSIYFVGEVLRLHREQKK